MKLKQCIHLCNQKDDLFNKKWQSIPQWCILLMQFPWTFSVTKCEEAGPLNSRFSILTSFLTVTVSLNPLIRVRVTWSYGKDTYRRCYSLGLSLGLQHYGSNSIPSTMPAFACQNLILDWSLIWSLTSYDDECSCWSSLLVKLRCKWLSPPQIHVLPT